MGKRRQDRAVRAALFFAGTVLAATLALGFFYRFPGSAPDGGGKVALPQVAEQAAFRDFLDGVWQDAAKQGIGRATFEAALAGITPDLSLLDRLGRQPEFEKSTGEYLAALVSDGRVAQGRAKLAELAGVLKQIEAAYGVNPPTLLAIWGIESDFGRDVGAFQVPRTLATLAFKHTSRAQFWRSELIAALAILEHGDIALSAMTGSWAGAMGQTQFMPSTYRSFAVDFDKDGRRDIWTSTADALASTANYLKASGWRTGEPWAIEVAPPANFDMQLADPATRKTIAEWQQLGLARPLGEAMPASVGLWSLLFPAGFAGPAFLVSDNFAAFRKYNNSTSYALAVGSLSDRIGGADGRPLHWPTPAHPLSLDERRELQQLLVLRGFITGTADGTFNERARKAVRNYQKARGLPADGLPSHDLLQKIRAEGR